MTYVKWQPARVVPALFNNLFTDTLNKEFEDLFNVSALQQKPLTNVTETATAYHVDVVVPGWQKENIKLNLDNGTLTVEGTKEAKTEKIETTETKSDVKTHRHEYHFSSFKRQFTMPDDVDIANINAEYVNGVLKITLNKKAKEQAPAATSISIA